MSDDRLRGVGKASVVILAMASLIVLAFSGTVWAQTFSDVKGDEYFATAVDALSTEGVIQGRGDGTFGASGSVTRAQLAVFLARTLHLAPGDGAPFTDVTTLDWCYGEVAALYQVGLVSGTSADVFSPSLDVNRHRQPPSSCGPCPTSSSSNPSRIPLFSTIRRPRPLGSPATKTGT